MESGSGPQQFVPAPPTRLDGNVGRFPKLRSFVLLVRARVDEGMEQ
jgi:hypothetical protein